MTESRIASIDARSAPRKGGAWGGLLLYGLLVAPVIWAIQLYLNVGLASHACFPSEAPRTSFLPGWERIWTALLVVSLVSLVIGAIGLLASGCSWRRLRNRQAPAVGADSKSVQASEERMRSLAAAGLMISGVFTVAILFDTLYLWALSTCSQV
jgi:hypothetical protein